MIKVQHLNRHLFTVFLMIAVTASSTYLCAQPARILKKYKLVFNDDFEKRFPATIINDKLWSRTPEWNQSTNKTNSMAWCVKSEDTLWDRAYMIRDRADSSTINVRNGICKLITDSLDYNGEIWTWPEGKFKVDTLRFNSRTGTLYSKEKFRFGYFEIRFRLPPAPDTPYTHQGFGPNFWLFGADFPNNNYWSEIDIFEINAFKPGSGRNHYTTNVHYSDKSTGPHPTRFSDYGNITSGEWHVASCIWTPRYIKMYLDHSLIHKVKRQRSFPVERLAAMSIIVDINSPASNFCTNFDPVYTAFPYVYEIDYVRVYQKE